MDTKRHESEALPNGQLEFYFFQETSGVDCFGGHLRHGHGNQLLID